MLQRAPGTSVLVNIYGARHGESERWKENDHLAPMTDAGREQVKMSGKNNLGAEKIHAAYSNGLPRLIETATLLLPASRDFQCDLAIRFSPGLSWLKSPGLNRMPEYSARIKEMTADGSPETIGMWKRVAPDMMDYLEFGVIAALKDMSIEVAEENPNLEVINILAASSSAVVEIPAGEEFRVLGEGDVVHYCARLDYRLVDQLGDKVPTVDFNLGRAFYLSKEGIAPREL